MKNIVIEIDGVRHIACKKGKGCKRGNIIIKFI